MRFDEVGYWSEVKLAIIREYAAAYSCILSRQKQPSLHHVYVDAFSGPGVHISRSTGDFIAGSPLNALLVEPPFKEFFFIDLDGDKVQHLREIVGDRTDVHIYQGDCNRLLISEVFTRVKWKDYRRALCLLDPYGLHLNWEVLETAGKTRSIEVFLNFPVADMNRNVLWRNPEGVSEDDIARMNAYWGDNSWRDIAYTRRPGLFGEDEVKATNKQVAEAFRRRLTDIAGFAYVPEPIPMKNSRGAIVYYLFFASHKPVAEHIVKQIFDKYRHRGTR